MIVLISTSYPISASGQEAAGGFVEDFALELSNREEVVVLAPGNARGIESKNGVTVYRYWSPEGVALSSLKIANLQGLWGILRVLCSGILSAFTIWKRERKPRFIFGLWVFPGGFWAYLLSRLTGSPFGTWALGSDIWSLAKAPVVGYVVRSILRRSSVNFADGYKICRDVEELQKGKCYFLPSSRSMPSVQSRQSENWKSRKLNVGFLGRWHPNKGVDILLELIGLMTDEDWCRINRFSVAGGGVQNQLVNEQCKKYIDKGLPVELSGYLSKDAAVQYLKSLDILVIPSRIESVPVVFSDAAQLCVVIVSTPVGDLKQLIEDFSCGEVASMVDAPALLDALRVTLRGDYSQYEGGLSNAAKFFSSENSVDEFCRLILEGTLGE